MIKFIQGQQTSLEGRTLLVSALSIGSVGTITLDLLIVNNQFKRIGYLNTHALESAAGILPSAYGQSILGLPAELYLSGDILILQLRSKVRKGYSKDLIREIKKLSQDNKLKEIIFIGSLTFGYNSRPDNEISSKQRVHHLSKGNTSLKLDEERSLNKLVVEGEEIEEYLENAGLCDEAYELLDNVVFFLIFANPIWDPKSSHALASYLREFLPFKQLSQPITKQIEA